MFDTSGHVAELDEPIAWAGFEPGGWILDLLCVEPLASLDDDGVLDRIEALERIRSLLDAEQSVALADFARRRARVSHADRCGADVGDEVALALRIAPRTADRRVDVAVQLTERLPATLSAMGRGRATLSKARVLLEETDQLSAADAAAVESAVIEGAADMTPGQLRRRAARAAIRIDAEAAARRRKQAETGRAVWVEPDACGMATLGASLCAADAVGIYELLDRSARAARTAGDQRTLDQLRADLLVQAIGGGVVRASRPLVQIVLPADAVTDDAAPPAELVGYGPIDHDLAREIVATGAWQRLLTDPATGTITDVGRTRYRPPAALADLVRARGRACAFPTCQQPAARCDLDHRRPWSAGGATNAQNLWPLCGRHHSVKDGSAGWSCALRRDGAITWTTPVGRVYTIHRDSDDDAIVRVTTAESTQPPEHPPKRPSEDLPPPF
ncbi:MAG: HNH endonuclease [Pseudonocardiales bacterium]|nr:MAG: HNH endonuclease [Pseudonocardiales bacterium]